MKNVLVSALVVLAATVAQAKVVHSKEVAVSPSSVEKVVTLVNKTTEDGGKVKLQVVVTDNGMSTDVSPRHSVYLGYANLAEMGNITAEFEVTEATWEFISATRTAPGIYEVKTVELGDEGMVEVTHTVDASKVFADEKALRNKCATEGDGFCHEVLKSTVTVLKTVKK